MNQNVINVAFAVILTFTAAVNVYATIKLNRSQAKFQSIFCIENP
ncbi:hypothetical protein [Bradyrhizobium sp. SZCCHNS3053]|nr:hypothetical protein [Bradyrhizobium sp. SZCCHNS3053]